MTLPLVAAKPIPKQLRPFEDQGQQERNGPDNAQNFKRGYVDHAGKGSA